MGRKKKEVIVPKFYLSGLMLMAWRKKTLDITQRDLARSLGNMNSQFISNWERGLCLPPKHAMPKILKQMQAGEKTALREALGNDLITHYWERF